MLDISTVAPNSSDSTTAPMVSQLVAVIGDSANLGSIGVHRAVGFSQVGVLKSVGRKFDRWLDVVMMEKTLGMGDTTAPD